MKRYGKLFCAALASVCLLVIALFAAACGGNRNDDHEKEQEKYVLSFVLPEGAGTIEPIQAMAGAQITPPAAPKIAGYVFEGWYLDAEGAGEKQELPTVMPAESRTYYAIYDEERFTITFVAEGLEIAPVTGKAGDPVPSVSAPYKSGYVFEGWYLNAEGTGEAQEIPSSIPSENRTYYALFTKVNTIQFIVGRGVTPIPDITGQAGDPVTAPADPVRDGAMFVGWYLQPNGQGEKQELPTVMPEEEFTVYYAYFRDYYVLSFEANVTGVNAGTMASVTADGEGKVTVPACTFAASGLYFLGWTDAANGVLSFNVEGGIADASGYLEGHTLTLTGDKTLYAQWAVGFSDADGSGDVVYVNTAMTGYGSAVLVRAGRPDKFGFLSEDGAGNAVFEFYFDAAEGGDVYGKLLTNGTFLYRDGTYGFWAAYDHVTNERLNAVFYSDGFGSAGVFTSSGEQLRLSAYGTYSYDTDYSEYVFIELDSSTGQPVDNGDGTYRGFYFILTPASVEGVTPPSGSDSAAGVKGYFIQKGGEAESYFFYDNGSIGGYLLELNGYGGARLYAADDAGQPVLTAEGTYEPTEQHESDAGEWEFLPDPKYSGQTASFRFLLSYVQDSSGYSYPVYLRYDALRSGELSEADGTGKLTLDGYGGMTYTSATGETYSGLFLYREGLSPNLIFYVYSAEGELLSEMYFDADWQARTFTVNRNVFLVDADGTLTQYTGSATIVEIPEEVGGVTVKKIADDVFNGSELVSVTIPATVEEIGARAFQNNDGTLRRVTFLGATPPTLDLASANDPFRWPSGSFVIVVPEEHKQAYVTAFTAAWNAGNRTGEMYRIKGSQEVNLLPEFEVTAEGVLIAYNRPETGDLSQPYDLVLTYGQTEYGGENILITAIADEVFMGDAALRSIDLGSVKTIGEYAFANCAQLTTVDFSAVETIGNGAFYYCEKLGAESGGVLVLESVKSIGAQAFRGCISLRRVTAGAGLASVGANAFAEIKTDSDTASPFYLVLTGTTPPEMASGSSSGESLGVFVGNSAYRIEIPDITYAIACYRMTSWINYCNSLYIPSGEEKGLYLSGSDLLSLDGRAVLSGTEVWLYAVSGETITFYSFSREAGTYTTFTGTIAGGVIAFTYNGTAYSFQKAGETVTYLSTDSAYTLIIENPRELDPEYWSTQLWYDEKGDPVYVTDEDGNLVYGADGKPMQATLPSSMWLASVRLNGTAAKMHVYGYTQKTISAFVENGREYNFKITLQSGGTFTYSKELVTRTYTAQDGSTLVFGGSETLLLANLTLKDFYLVVGGVYTRVNDSAEYSATSAYTYSLGGNVYAAQINIRGTYYLIYLRTEGESFAYGAGLAGRTAKYFAAATGEGVFVCYDGESIVSAAIVLPEAGFTAASSLTSGGDTLTLTAGDPAVTYTVTLGSDGTCTVTKSETKS